MRARSLTALALAASLPLSCNAVLGNQPGHLVADGGDDATVAAEGAADASPDEDASHEASDGPEGDASPPWTPAAIPSLVLWLDSDVGVAVGACGGGMCVETWADRTQNHNDGYPWAAQARPLLVADQYNGHAAVRFDGVGTQLTIADNVTLQFQSGRYTIFAVIAEQPTSTDGTIYAKTAPGYPYAGPGMWASIFNQGAGIAPTEGRIGAQVDYTQLLLSREYGLDDGVLRLVESDCDGTTLTLRVGDEAPLTRNVVVDAGGLNAVGKDAYIGAQPMVAPPSDPQAFLGDMTEVLVANDALSAADLKNVSDYLTAKYALGDGGAPDAGPVDAAAEGGP